MEEAKLLDEIETVDQILKHADLYGLQAEIMTTAFKYMQDHPGCSIDDALTAGLAAWDILY